MHSRKPADIFAENLHRRIEEMDISQSEAARRSGMHHSLMHRYLTKRTTPGFDKLEKLAAALETEPWQLLHPDGAKAVVQEPTPIPLSDVMEAIDFYNRFKKLPPDMQQELKKALGLSE